MEVTSKNKRAANKILAVLIDEQCTIRESREIFTFVQRFLETQTVVNLAESQIEGLFVENAN